MLIKSKLDGQPRQINLNIDIVLVVDISGSMSHQVENDTRLNLAKDAINKLIQAMDDNDRLGLTVFNDTGTVLFNLTKISDIKKDLQK